MGRSARASVVLFRDHPAENWFSMERYADGLEKALRSLAPPDLRITSVVPPAPWPVPRGLLLRRMIAYPSWARRRQGDINHVLDHSYGHLLLALDPTRTVVTVHDIAPLLFPGKPWGVSRLSWLLSWRGTLRAERLIAVSAYMRRTLIGRFALSPDRVIFIPEGVEPTFHPLPREEVREFRRARGLPEGPLLLHVGHTQPRKNLEGLLRALALLRRWDSRIRLIQVGGTPTAKQRQLIASLGLQGAVLFLGTVSDEDLVVLYNVADVFVFPSLYEGFGFPLLEAMACGTPVVAGNTSSVPEVVGDAGLLVNPRSPEAIADAVRRVLADGDLAEDLRRRGLARAQTFTWERTARETLAVYETLLAR